MERITVFGLGYVGLTTAVCFAELGNLVYGVDINPERVSDVRNGRPRLPVGGIYDLLNKQLDEKRLIPTTNYHEALENTSISYVCVQTPCKPNGDLDLGAVNRVCRQIGSKIGYDKDKSYQTVVIRSTVFPGTVERLERILEETSGMKCHSGFGLAVNPEFLREAYAVEDFFNPPMVLVGTDSKEDADDVFGCYEGIKADRVLVKPEVAQMIKYVNNSWHACKVAFTNDIGEICRRVGVDGNAVMDLFKRDHRLNVSEYYHMIGQAYGGHCLPKDLSVLQVRARKANANVPLIDAISKSNDCQIRRDK